MARTDIRPPRVPFTKSVKRGNGEVVQEITREWYRYLLTRDVSQDATEDTFLLNTSNATIAAVIAELSKRVAYMEADQPSSDSARIAELEKRIADLEANLPIYNPAQWAQLSQRISDLEVIQ